MCWTKLRQVIKKQFPKRYYWKPICIFLVPPSKWTLEVNALLMVKGSGLRLSCPISQISVVFRELVTLNILPRWKGRKKFIFLALKIHLGISLYWKVPQKLIHATPWSRREVMTVDPRPDLFSTSLLKSYPKHPRTLHWCCHPVFTWIF